jgi:transcriptional regulator with XRE-family HTH domain
MPEIGETLREARMRARIDVSEIEARTKIRAKYLRALENEEWGLLPGPTFVKSFLRTYAQALGLDGKALVEEYRINYEVGSDPAMEPAAAGSQRTRGGGRLPRPGSPSRGYLALIAGVSLLILLLIVGLVAGGGSSSPRRAHTTAKDRRTHGGGAAGTSPYASTVSVSLKATGTVYVCLVGEGGRKLIGQTLEAGTKTATYTGRYFDLVLGSSAVALTIDGRLRTVPESSEVIRYSITKAGRRTLAPGHLPMCT